MYERNIKTVTATIEVVLPYVEGNEEELKEFVSAANNIMNFKDPYLWWLWYPEADRDGRISEDMSITIKFNPPLR